MFPIPYHVEYARIAVYKKWPSDHVIRGTGAHSCIKLQTTSVQSIAVHYGIEILDVLR